MSTDSVLTERLLAAARIEALSRALAEAEKQRDEALRERSSYEIERDGSLARVKFAVAKLRVAVEALRPLAGYRVISIGMDLEGYVIKLEEGGQQPTFADFARVRGAIKAC
jgi:hypothetical protein